MKARDVTTFTEHRQKLREDFEHVRRSGGALLITTNGKPDAVVLSPEAYDHLTSEAELARSIQTIRKSMAEHAQGLGIPADKVFAKVRRTIARRRKA